MENKVVLSKNSNSDEIKAYFLEVSRLSKSNEEFPVDLDDVWPLVYERKDNAVKSLIKYFIQGVYMRITNTLFVIRNSCILYPQQFC